MSITLGIVEVACGSGDRKRAESRRLGGRSVLEFVVRRTTDCLHLDRAVVVTADTADEAWVRELVPPDVDVFAGQADDVAGRFLAAVSAFDAAAVVRISGHNPFIDPVLVDRLITTAAAHSNCDYIGYCSRKGRRALKSPLGMYAEWFSAAAFERAARAGATKPDLSNMTAFVFSNPKAFQARLIPLPAELDHADVRLVVDATDAWEHAQAVYEAFGAEGLDWFRIAQLTEDSVRRAETPEVLASPRPEA